MKAIDRRIGKAVADGKAMRTQRDTVIVDEHGRTVLRLFNTNIVTVYHNGKGYVITLDSGGWYTDTTKRRMNAVLAALNSGKRIYQHEWQWYVTDWNDDSVPDTLFHNGMTVFVADS